MEEGKKGKNFVLCIDMERCPRYSKWKKKWAEECMLSFEEKNVKQSKTTTKCLYAY